MIVDWLKEIHLSSFISNATYKLYTIAFQKYFINFTKWILWTNHEAENSEKKNYSKEEGNQDILKTFDNLNVEAIKNTRKETTTIETLKTRDFFLWCRLFVHIEMKKKLFFFSVDNILSSIVMHFHNFIASTHFLFVYFIFLQCSKSIDSKHRENSIDCETNQTASTYSGARKKIVGKENSLAQKFHVENKNVKSTVTSSETPTRQAPSSYLKSKFYCIPYVYTKQQMK